MRTGQLCCKVVACHAEMLQDMEEFCCRLLWVGPHSVLEDEEELPFSLQNREDIQYFEATF